MRRPLGGCANRRSTTSQPWLTHLRSLCQRAAFNRTRLPLTSGLFALALIPRLAQTQAPSACHPQDAAGARLVRWVSQVVTKTDDAAIQQRALMKLSPVPAGDVSYVTDPTVCANVMEPYNAHSEMREAATGAPVAPSGQLYVVRVGRDYVAWDPAKTAGEFGLCVTLDNGYHVLASALC